VLRNETHSFEFIYAHLFFNTQFLFEFIYFIYNLKINANKNKN